MTPFRAADGDSVDAAFEDVGVSRLGDEWSRGNVDESAACVAGWVVVERIYGYGASSADSPM